MVRKNGAQWNITTRVRAAKPIAITPGRFYADKWNNARQYDKVINAADVLDAARSPGL